MRRKETRKEKKRKCLCLDRVGYTSVFPCFSLRRLQSLRVLFGVFLFFLFDFVTVYPVLVHSGNTGVGVLDKGSFLIQF